MRFPIVIVRPLVVRPLVFATLALAACGRGRDGGASGASAGDAAASTGPAAVQPKTQPARRDPCSWVSAAEAARLLGPLAGQPHRGHEYDDPAPDADGQACVYPLTPRDDVPEGSVVAVDVDVESAIGFETGKRAVGGIVAKQLEGLGGKPLAPTAAESASAAAEQRRMGWDYIGGYSQQLSGRVGHVAVRASWGGAYAVADSVLALVTLIRDRIPDLPFASERLNSGREGRGDACALLTRAEAEKVLGPLAIPPYHSRDFTALADPGGAGCSYYTGHHRVLSIQPTWSQGKTLFRLVGGLSQLVNSKLQTGSATDTLEGKWDQVGSPGAGLLYFLKGDRMLAVSYGVSSADLPGALELASKAVARLAATH
jgi:hypothetical protein